VLLLKRQEEAPGFACQRLEKKTEVSSRPCCEKGEKRRFLVNQEGTRVTLRKPPLLWKSEGRTKFFRKGEHLRSAFGGGGRKSASRGLVRPRKKNHLPRGGLQQKIARRPNKELQHALFLTKGTVEKSFLFLEKKTVWGEGRTLPYLKKEKVRGICRTSARKKKKTKKETP